MIRRCYYCDTEPARYVASIDHDNNTRRFAVCRLRCTRTRMELRTQDQDSGAPLMHGLVWLLVIVLLVAAGFYSVWRYLHNRIG